MAAAGGRLIAVRAVATAASRVAAGRAPRRAPAPRPALTARRAAPARPGAEHQVERAVHDHPGDLPPVVESRGRPGVGELPPLGAPAQHRVLPRHRWRVRDQVIVRRTPDAHRLTRSDGQVLPVQRKGQPQVAACQVGPGRGRKPRPRRRALLRCRGPRLIARPALRRRSWWCVAARAGSVRGART